MGKLTIGIPTFNQPQNINSVLSKFSNSKLLKDDVEFIIIDDSTNYKTSQIVNNHKSRFEIIYYHRNCRNIDSAIKTIVKLSKGKYTWIFGDDNPNIKNVEKLVKILQIEEYKLYVLNSSSSENKKNSTYDWNYDFEIINNNFFLKYDMGLVGFISSFIIETNLAKKSLKNIDKYMGLNFIIIHIILTVLSNSGKIKALHQNYFYSKPKIMGTKRWYDPVEVFGINLLIIFEDHLHLFERKKFFKAKSNHIENLCKAILLERSKNFYDSFGSKNFNYLRFVPYYWRHLKFWFYLPLLFIPNKLLHLFNYLR